MKLTKQHIEIMSRAIDAINNHELECGVTLQTDIEDVDYFLKVLKRVQPSKLKQVTSSKKTKKLNALPVTQYDEKSVYPIFTQFTEEELEEKFSLAQLKSMYIGIYGTPPLSKSTKQSIISTIRKRFHQLERVDAFQNSH